MLTGQALDRIETLTRKELEAGDVTPEIATAWRDFYIWHAANMNNPSAPGRALLMQYAVELLAGGRE
jgi:hypothetical protein